jgi:hypothetical protein
VTKLRIRNVEAAKCEKNVLDKVFNIKNKGQGGGTGGILGRTYLPLSLLSTPFFY